MEIALSLFLASRLHYEKQRCGKNRMKTSRWILKIVYALCFTVLAGVLGTCDLSNDAPSKGCYVLLASGWGDFVEIDAGFGGQDGPAMWENGFWRDTWQGEDAWQKVIGEDEAQEHTAGSDHQYLWVRVRGQGSLYAEAVHVDNKGYVLRTGTLYYADGQEASVVKVDPPPMEGGGGGVGWGWSYPTVICAELHRQGLMEETIFEADEAFGRYLGDNDRDVLMGYQLWAKPVVKWMQRSKTATRIVATLATPWSYEMAYRMGARDEGSVEGKILMFIGVPVCRAIGRAMIWAGNMSPRDDAGSHEDPCSGEFVIPTP